MKVRNQVGVTLCALSVLIPLAGEGATASRPVDTAAKGSASSCFGRGPINAAELRFGVSTSACSLVGRVVVSGDVSVVIPSAGGGVAADGVGTTATPGTSLRVTNVGGVVTATSESSSLADTAARPGVRVRTAALGGSPPACQDGAFKQEGHAWKTTLKWGYHSASTPGRMTARGAVTAIRRGIENIRDGQDNCGLAGQPRASSDYVGSTAAKPNIVVKDGSVRCGSRNSRNTVGWGSLPGNLLGWTCYWWNARQNMVEADMRLDPSRRTVLSYPANCSSKFDLQSLATHEWGHVFGLSHPGSGHANLTMTHLLPPCSKAPRTLGLGDWRGMRKLYGLR